MIPEDFPQFDDPRVREVMAAAANLVERIARSQASAFVHDGADMLKTALFAAQHSKPKEGVYPCPLRCGDYTDERDVPCHDCLRG